MSTSTIGSSTTAQNGLRKVFRFPASFSQRRLWFLEQLEPGSSSYNLPSAVRIEGPLDRSALQRAMNEMVRRHESLRTRFTSIHGEPYQVIEQYLQLEIPTADLGRNGLASAADCRADVELMRVISADVRKPFDLKRGPLLRLTLFQLGEADHILLMVMHHIISDAWSIGVLMREFSLLYGALSEGYSAQLQELPIQYADFTAWQQKWLSGPVLQKQLGYWKKQLADVPALELPTDYPRTASPGDAGAFLHWNLSSSLTGALKELAQSEGATLFMTLLAAFQLLLSRYAGQADLAVGTPIAGRRMTETEALIGFFVNTLVIRTDLSGDLTFRELLRRVREITLAAYSHQDLPFERLIEELNPRRDFGRTPLFQVMFVLQNASQPKLHLRDSKLSAFDVENGAATFDLTLVAAEIDGELRGIVNYRTALFKESTVRRLLAHWSNLLATIVSHPDRAGSGLSLMSCAERQQVLQEWNSNSAPYPRTSAHRLFDLQAERTPKEAAVIWSGGKLTYSELQSRVWQMGACLRDFGAGPEKRVAICVEPGEHLIAAILGTLAAGAAYVPLDPDYPAERLRWIMNETHPEVVITESQFRDKFLQSGARLFFINQEWDRIAQLEAKPFNTQVDPANLLYVIYTSGSTGRAKGVAIAQESLISRIHFLANVYGMKPGDRCLQILSPSFDAFGGGMYAALFSGGGVVFQPPEVILDPAGLLSSIEQELITHLRIPVGYLRQFLLHLVENQKTVPDHLRIIVTGGETISRSEMREWLQRCAPHVRFIHEYGPTETTITATLFEDDRSAVSISPHRFVIGRPHPNTPVYVLTEGMEPAGVGVAGELYIGGVAIARGYFGNGHMTAERFVPNPFASEPGARLYRTGDWVRWMEDGRLEFLGRRDEQVKIHGYRVELGEVEAAMRAHERVKEAAAAIREDGNGNKCLVGYVVPSQRPLIPADIRSYLQEILPDYMVPAAFVEVAELPLMPGGKLDRKALPQPSFESEKPTRTSPRDPIEEILCGIWADLLKREFVSIEDNFFEIGGHSLLATQLISRVRLTFGVELPLRTLFESPTIAGLAQRIQESKENSKASVLAPIQPADRNKTVPLSFAQQRLWLLDQLQPFSPAYNMPTALRVRGKLDIAAFHSALNQIVRRHEVLRTSFHVVHGEPAQIISDELQLPLPLTDLSAYGAEERECEALRVAQVEAARPFDLEQGPLIRGQLVRLAEEDHLLLITMHHIVSDGWSMGIMVRELASLYGSCSSSQSATLPEPTIQYADFAVWQRAWLKDQALDEQLEYWRKQLADLPLLELSADHPRPAVRSERGSVLTWSVGAELSRKLIALSRSQHATLFMTLLSSFQLLLSRYSGQKDIAVGTPIAGRRWAETENLIGFFANTLVLRADLSGSPNFVELLQRVRKTTLDAYSRQDVPFEKLVEVLSPVRDLSRTPLFQAMFILQNASQPHLALGDASVEPFNVDSKTAKFDLSMAVAESSSGLRLAIEYSSDLFEQDTVQRMAQHYENLLAAIVASPERPVADYELLSWEESRQLLVDWNDTEQRASSSACLPEILERQAAQTPDALAVKDGENELTYGELIEQARKMARYLRDLGAGPEARVAVCMKRSTRLVATLLGILEAGAAYVPLDPAYPHDRLRYMLDDAQAQVLITEESFIGKIPLFTGQTLLLEQQWTEIQAQSAEPLPTAVEPDNLAYVIYTSGSTGRPKGTAICHSSVSAFLHWAHQVFSSDELKTVLAATSICFDLSIFEIFAPLGCGGSVLIAKDALDFASMKDANRVTLINTVPSAMRELLRMNAVPETVRTVNLAGEALPANLVQEIHAKTHSSRLFNLYGPSEDTTYSTFACLPRSETISVVPIGRPISNTQGYVLDKLMHPVPVGVAGELYLGGAGLARGYLNRPDLTAEKFVPDPFAGKTGSRLYRTGDLVKYLPDGNLVFLGRMDHQVKIRGFRIELGEIETALARHPAIQTAVALAYEQASGDQSLAGYVALRPGKTVSDQELRDSLRQTLPEYMVPSQLFVLEELPLTLNGKVDRKRLPSPGKEKAAPKQSITAPVTKTEEALALIWAEVLSIEKVGLDNNFFDLGGHSLLVPRVRAAVKEKLGRDVAMVDFFSYPTVRGLARRLELSNADAEPNAHVEESHERASRQHDHLRRRRKAQQQPEKETA